MVTEVGEIRVLELRSGFDRNNLDGKGSPFSRVPSACESCDNLEVALPERKCQFNVVSDLRLIDAQRRARAISSQRNRLSRNMCEFRRIA